MNTYTVKSTDGSYNIIADNWSVGHEGLKFYQREKVVAWFTTWDYWICNSEDFYTGLDEIKEAYKAYKSSITREIAEFNFRHLVDLISQHILGMEDENKSS
jgi:hypothetical protein